MACSLPCLVFVHRTCRRSTLFRQTAGAPSVFLAVSYQSDRQSGIVGNSTRSCGQVAVLVQTGGQQKV